ncbi:MAG: methylated-DNA--[protein]-cysteine S-methyltransferase [Burkholderiaceae bacterium]|nr:methylated-DNA--[protein]-cysteine S-methyltransferase [Burkholderiaceae bacterium]
MKYYGIFDTALGRLLLVETRGALAGLYFMGQKYQPEPSALAGQGVERDDTRPIFARTLEQIEHYATGQRTRFELPLAPAGTEFQRSVWQALAAIPYGRTDSYGALATAIGRPRAARAVGAAVGRNPISVVIPCHRALGADGALTGFAAGLDCKRRLLALESAGAPE